MIKTIKKYSRRILKKALKLADKYFGIVSLVAIILLSMPHISLAHSLETPTETSLKFADIMRQVAQNQEIKVLEAEANRLPDTSTHREPRMVTKITLTAYNSLPNQTDSTPCITASGLDVCERDTEDVIATNYLRLPFGTKVKFPELYGDKIFTIEDRMNARYHQRADIWLKSYDEARRFGKKWTTIEIY